MPSSIEIRDAGYADVVYVARRMRTIDRRELYAFEASENPEVLASRLVAWSRFQWCAFLDWEPVAVINAIEEMPTLWRVGMFATDLWPRVGLNCTLFFRQVIFPKLEGLGCNRAECRSIAEHVDSHRWLQILGARRECMVTDVGLNRDTYIQFAWTRSEYECRSVRKMAMSTN